VARGRADDAARLPDRRDGRRFVLARARGAGDVVPGRASDPRRRRGSDAGWAGSHENLRTDPWLLSAGLGVSLLDGLVRVDLARAMKLPTGWRLMAYLDAWQ